MPNNQYKILITKPCTKNWDAMQPTDVGRHCNSCKKEVIDFSVLSDDEVKNYLISKIGKETCGRFYHHQIDRIKIVLPQHILHSNIAKWKKFLVVLMICFGVQLFSIDVSLAQTIDSIPALDSIKQVDSLNKEKKIIMGDGIVDSIDIENKIDSTNLFIDTNMSIGSTILNVEFTFPIESTFVYGGLGIIPENIPIETLGIIGLPPTQILDTSSPINTPKNTKSKKPQIPNKKLPLNNPPYLPEEIFTLNKRKKK